MSQIQERTMFVVKENAVTKKLVAVNGADKDGAFEFQLAPELQMLLKPGDVFSLHYTLSPKGSYIEYSSDVATDLFVENDPTLTERKEFEGMKEAERGWTPRTGDSRYSPATPDNGRFSGPFSPEAIQDSVRGKSLDSVGKSRTIPAREIFRRDPFSSRLVPKTACPDKNQLAEYIRQTTGGQVTALGEPVDRDLNWEIETFSGDGKP